MFWRLPLCVLLMVLVGLPAAATTLTFEIESEDFPLWENYPEGELVNQEYGDRVTSTQSTQGSYTYNYLIGAEGATPNVTVDYGPFSIFTGGPKLWRYDFGDLDRVLYQGSLETLDGDGQPIGFNYDWMMVTLRADPGFDVLLYGFDMGTWTPSGNESLQIARLAVFGSDVSGPDLPVPAAFEVLNPTIAGIDGGLPSRSSFAFGNPIRGNTVTILIDARNLGDLSEAIGIDNIRFGQDEAAAIPEPGTGLLLLAGLGVLQVARRRRGKHARRA